MTVNAAAPIRSTPWPSAARLQLTWLAGGLAFGFAIPFVFADALSLPRDIYYAIYAIGVLAFLGIWVASTGQQLGAMLRRRRAAALGLGLAFAGVMALIVVTTEDATARPGDASLVGALIWRGLVYGAVDGLFLSAFPILAVVGAFAGTRLSRRRTGRVAIGGAALLASLAMTAAYHAGYEQFRSSDLRSPLTGDLIWSVPTLVTLNPIGAPIAHTGLHVAAVFHSYDTELMLPPHQEDEGGS